MTSTEQIRMYTFLIGCIGTRLLIAYMAKIMNTKYLQYTSIPALIIGVTMIYLYATNQRQYGYEAGGKIWWNKQRPYHGLLFIIYALMAYKKNKYAYVLLLIDALFGLINYLLNRLWV